MSLKKVYEYFRVVTCMGNELIEIDCQKKQEMEIRVEWFEIKNNSTF